ncbi:MAG: RHS repeat-associated core domain-containing protein [Chitinophagaceae bacterium]
MDMPGRQYSAGNGYRYGFNGKEKDTEEPVQYDYGFRIYDPRLVRFKSVDPIARDYPWYTPYQFAGNTPIQAIDLDGGEPKGYKWSNPYVTSHSGSGVKQIPSQYDNQAWMVGINGGSKELMNVYAVQDIDKKCYLIFETATGAKAQWYIEYDKDGYKGDVNSFTWSTPPDPTNVLYAMTVGPLVGLPALVTGGFALGTIGWTSLATRGIMTYWRWAPLIGAAGRTLAEFLDETGSAGMSNASRWAKLTLAEQIVVKTLVETGRDVKLLSPSNASKTADFIIDGVSTELKTLTADVFNRNTAVTKITEAFKQGKNALLDARKYDLSKEQVQSIYDGVVGSLKKGGKEVGGVEIWTQSGAYKF